MSHTSALKRFLIPMMLFVNAESKNEAENSMGVIVDLCNDAIGDEGRPKLYPCLESETFELDIDPFLVGAEPRGLDDFLTRAIHAEMARRDAAFEAQRQEFAIVLGLLEKAGTSLSGLIHECESNQDFADEHASEVEALGAAEEAQHELKQYLDARAAAGDTQAIEG